MSWGNHKNTIIEVRKLIHNDRWHIVYRIGRHIAYDCTDQRTALRVARNMDKWRAGTSSQKEYEDVVVP